LIIFLQDSYEEIYKEETKQ
jgi:hypothetical protein